MKKESSSLVMLAADATENDFVFPALFSPKIDAYRFGVKNGLGVVGRAGNAVANKATQSFFSHPALEALDGELAVGSPNAPDVFSVTGSGLKTHKFDPKATFFVFDYICAEPFVQRIARVEAVVKTLPSQFSERVIALAQVMIHNKEQLLQFEETCVNLGFEGVCGRNPRGAHKLGRSTLEEQGLLKLKRFVDAEAIIIGMEEEIDKAGHPKNTMGSLVCVECKTKEIFNIGGGKGLTLNEREKWWKRRDPTQSFMNGKTRAYRLSGGETPLATYSYFPVGTKTKPRHPKLVRELVGERMPEDLEVVA